MRFAERLATLPAIDHLSGLQLLDDGGEVVGVIANQPGQTGSLAVYHALAQQHGGLITPEAAQTGLLWYGEHLADAVAHPGKHPNIDRLRSWAAGTCSHRVQPLPR